MDEDALESQMMRFWDRDADVLVCTTIIESGLDVPNANTLVVDRADMLGLAQLYQLRGRVGRSSERAFAYFFFPPVQQLTEEAHERLATISAHQALGSGFRIALRDLEIRGAGNLLGAEQHGHIAAVGFDAYCRILQQSVAELQGEPIAEEKELRIDLPVRAFVPPGWVAQESLRLELYRRISLAADHDALGRILEETIDRYGALPPEVQTLFAIASLRVTCAALGIEEVSTYREQVRIRPVALDDALRVDLPDRVPGSTYHEAKRTLNLAPERIAGADLPGWVEARLREAVGDPVVRRPGEAAPAFAGCTARLSVPMFSLRAPRLLLIASVAFAVAACGAGKPEVASVGDREVAEADLDQAAALQHVLAELQGAVCGGQPAEGESADTACDRVALSGELLWLAVAPVRGGARHHGDVGGGGAGGGAARDPVRCRPDRAVARRARPDARGPPRARRRRSSRSGPSARRSRRNGSASTRSDPSTRSV